MKVINIERVAGVVQNDETERLRKLIFRATKGKAYIYTEPFQDTDDRGNVTLKTVYIITFYDGAHTRDKIYRICDSFTGQRYNLPELGQLAADIQRMGQSVTNQRSVLDRTRHELRKQLIEFDNINGNVDSSGQHDGSSTIYIYKMFLAQEKALYMTLNMMRAQNDRLFGYFWAPVEQEHNIRTTLASQPATKITHVEDNYHIQPPTYIKKTEFTWVFQTIVDTYGVPTYKEANPTPISIVTFPFYFGMMFGDLGHGSILFLFGFFLVMFNERLKKTAWKGVLPMRYFLMMNGFWAFYMGFAYNEFFSMPTQIFHSCYDMSKKKRYPLARPLGPPGNETSTYAGGDYIYQRYNGSSLDCTYPFGVDPVWGLSGQRLSLANNIKMKLSVIYGVIHMTFGVLHKGANTFYHKDWIGFFFEVCSGLLILLPLFGWMDVLIYGKWLNNSYPLERFAHGQDIYQTSATTYDYIADIVNRKTPGVINILITTVFQGGKPAGGVEMAYLWKYNEGWWNQKQNATFNR